MMDPIASPEASVRAHPLRSSSFTLTLALSPSTTCAKDESPIAESAKESRSRLVLAAMALPMGSIPAGPRSAPISSSSRVFEDLTCAATAKPSFLHTLSSPRAAGLGAVLGLSVRVDGRAGGPPARASHFRRMTDIFLALRRPSPSTWVSSAESGTRFTEIADALVMFSASALAPSAMPGLSRRLTSVSRKEFHCTALTVWSLSKSPDALVCDVGRPRGRGAW